MKSYLKCCVFLITFFIANIPTTKTYASHCAGAELLFQWVHDSTYQIFYKFYRDCSGIQEASTVTLCYNNTCDNNTNSVNMAKVTTLIPPGVGNGAEVLQLCPGFYTTCTQSSSSIPGYREWWYTAIITLPSRCNSWTFAVYQSARNSAITNLTNPGGQTLYTEATLDNLDAQGDTSPFFNVKPVPYVCNTFASTFNCSTFDINNDSVVYTMIQPLTNAGTCTGSSSISWATATPSYNLTDNPFQTNNTFSLNSTNGLMTFTPSQTQIAVLTVRADEYRNGLKIGSVMRDMQVIVLSCAGGQPSPPVTVNPFDVIGASFSSTPDNNIVAYGGINMSFKIASSIQPATNKIILISNNAYTALGSTFTIPPYYSSGNDTGIFSWTPFIYDTGDHYVVFTAVDSCNGNFPFLVSSTYTLRIHVIGSNDSNLCNSFAIGASLDRSDIGRFIIGTDTFGSVYSHLSNSAAINSYTFHPDTIQLYIDSTYNIQEAGIMHTIHDADAKVTLFMDFNASQQFDIPDERVWTTYQRAFYYYIVDTAITIPNTVVTDVPVLMRLILNNDTGASAASDSACGPYMSGETEDFIVIFRNATTSVTNLANIKSIRFWPNPTSGKFAMTLDCNNSVKQLRLNISAVTGQNIFSRYYHDVDRHFSTHVDMSTFPKGLYFIETDADGERQISKIVVK